MTSTENGELAAADATDPVEPSDVAISVKFLQATSDRELPEATNLDDVSPDGKEAAEPTMTHDYEPAWVTPIAAADDAVLASPRPSRFFSMSSSQLRDLDAPRRLSGVDMSDVQAAVQRSMNGLGGGPGRGTNDFDHEPLSSSPDFRSGRVRDGRGARRPPTRAYGAGWLAEQSGTWYCIARKALWVSAVPDEYGGDLLRDGAPLNDLTVFPTAICNLHICASPAVVHLVETLLEHQFRASAVFDFCETRGNEEMGLDDAQDVGQLVETVLQSLHREQSRAAEDTSDESDHDGDEASHRAGMSGSDVLMGSDISKMVWCAVRAYAGSVNRPFYSGRRQQAFFRRGVRNTMAAESLRQHPASSHGNGKVAFGGDVHSDVPLLNSGGLTPVNGDTQSQTSSSGAQAGTADPQADVGQCMTSELIRRNGVFVSELLSILLSLGITFWADIVLDEDSSVRNIAFIKSITPVFRLHALTAEDLALSATTIKLERFGMYMYVVLPVFQQHALSGYSTISALLFENAMLTVTYVNSHDLVSRTGLSQSRRRPSGMQLTRDDMQASVDPSGSEYSSIRISPVQHCNGGENAVDKSLKQLLREWEQTLQGLGSPMLLLHMQQERDHCLRVVMKVQELTSGLARDGTVGHGQPLSARGGTWANSGATTCSGLHLLHSQRMLFRSESLDFVFYRVVDAVVDEYVPLMRAINGEVVSMDEISSLGRGLKEERRDFTLRVHNAAATVNSALRMVVQMRAVLQTYTQMTIVPPLPLCSNVSGTQKTFVCPWSTNHVFVGMCRLLGRLVLREEPASHVRHRGALLQQKLAPLDWPTTKDGSSGTSANARIYHAGMQKQRMPGHMPMSGVRGKRRPPSGDLPVDTHDERPVWLCPDSQLFMHDPLDHTITMFSDLQAAKESCERIHRTYTSFVSMELSEIANSQSTKTTLLSVLATILLPLTVVSSVMGMNIDVPFASVDSLYPFFGIVFVSLIVSTLGVLVILRS